MISDETDARLGLDAGATAALVADLVARHGVHTIVVYGSRARGQGRPDSDLDVLSLCDARDGPPEVRDTRLFRGCWLDAFVVHAPAFTVTEPYLRLEGGLVLLDRDGLGARALSDVEALLERGPDVPAETLAAHADWLDRMLERIVANAGTTLGDARRVQLQEQLIPEWFAQRRRWFRGPQWAITTLLAEAPEDLEALSRALRCDAGLTELRAAVRVIQAAGRSPGQPAATARA